MNRFRQILEDHFYVISGLELRSNERFDFTFSYLLNLYYSIKLNDLC